MSIARFALAEAALADAAASPAKSKTPPKRQAIARADAIAVPEPR